MLDIKLRISWSELCPDSVLNGESVFACFEKRRLGEPCWSENLEWVGVLARLQGLFRRELHHDLFHGDNLLGLSMMVLYTYDSICDKMTALDSLKLND